MKPVLPILAGLLLLGCVREPAPQPIPPVPVENALSAQEPDSCGAAKLAGLVGQNEGMLRTVPIKGPVRTIPFGTLVTQEYSTARLNVYLDQTGAIAQISCG